MHSRKNVVFKIVIVIFLFALLVINSKSVNSPVRTNLTDSSAVPLKSFSAIFSFFKKLVPFASLREENGILRERINLLSRNIDEMKVVMAENERLKDIIDFRKTIPYTTIPAKVIGRDSANWSNSVIIDKGLAGGIKSGKAVLSTKGLVGRVLEVGKHSSRILLITDPNSKVGVIIQKNRQGGVLIGRPDGKCKMIYIALDSDVAPGDRVITAGFGSVFPKDILIGKVVRIGKEPGRLYKYAIVKTADDLNRIEEVLCIK